MAHTKEALYSNKIFLNAALPLVKVIANDVPSLKKKFENVQAVIQVSCLDPECEAGKQGMHFIINNGEWLVHTCLTEDPDIELQFKSIENLNDFFKGKITPAGIPKIKGLKKAGTLVSFVMVLLKMADLLGATEPPKDEETKELLVKCYFYLLSSGISQLNKWVIPKLRTGQQRALTVFTLLQLTTILRFQLTSVSRPVNHVQAVANTREQCLSSHFASTTSTVLSVFL